ncbi:DUF502 domain-containing protein [Alicyclobacillus cycloheptanicus]|jgi:uncharacterized membrane protein|uniref:Membrane protein n=1 Tax=Alicyclobacillus cycloheptanicus TaxID=1457 RepID=A0ABT9XD54_9BACL|nr:DUF502 domain-containing protein [Alicyclobacillus cycloheptanicus]MDQ0188229.1 putative membrane protein [Alicyclobacillus cycloheptanicus]WDM00957.1 DUF502 domain-containing protein [Alicyclobacillus cycloheptanicus]
MRIFREIAKHFGIGLVTILPFALVIWVLVTIFQLVDGLFGPWVDHWFGTDVPGVGFVLVLIGTTLVGALTKFYVSHQVLQLMDGMFRRIPFVKSLYVTFKELVQSLLGGKKRGFRRAVLVNWPDERAQVVGLVTNEELPSHMDPTGERVAVYLPNTFQFAGITVLVERSRISPCDLTVEEAFKFAISGGLTNVHGESGGEVPEKQPAAGSHPDAVTASLSEPAEVPSNDPVDDFCTTDASV